jgi:sulfur carrier protein ThiS
MVRMEGREFRWREGMTVADLLKEWGDPYPYAVVRIGDRLISRPDFDKATLPDEAEVFPIPLISGG